jgi:hemerythrin-like domain-containing protein
MSTTLSRQPVHIDAPLAEFSKCHGEFVAQLHAALYLPDLLASAARARAMATDLLRLFRRGLLAHHEDEERELFPAVLRAAQPGEEYDRLDAMVQRLESEHRAIATLWRQIEPSVQGIENGEIPALNAALLDDIVQNFFAHIHFEEDEFLPLAQQVLERHRADMAHLGEALERRHAHADYLGLTG